MHACSNCVGMLDQIGSASYSGSKCVSSKMGSPARKAFATEGLIFQDPSGRWSSKTVHIRISSHEAAPLTPAIIDLKAPMYHSKSLYAIPQPAQPREHASCRQAASTGSHGRRAYLCGCIFTQGAVEARSTSSLRTLLFIK